MYLFSKNSIKSELILMDTKNWNVCTFVVNNNETFTL